MQQLCARCCTSGLWSSSSPTTSRLRCLLRCGTCFCCCPKATWSCYMSMCKLAVLRSVKSIQVKILGGSHSLCAVHSNIRLSELQTKTLHMLYPYICRHMIFHVSSLCAVCSQPMRTLPCESLRAEAKLRLSAKQSFLRELLAPVLPALARQCLIMSAEIQNASAETVAPA